MLDRRIFFPSHFYPAFAPLPVSMADHLLYKEQRRYRRRPTKSPPPDELVRTVLERISQARTVIYEYMTSFVLAEQERQKHAVLTEREHQQRGENRPFPNPDWLLKAMAQYAPKQKTYDESTLDYWQNKGFLRREKKRGLFDITSIAALLIARLAEATLQKEFLPEELSESEPRWWCYGRISPGAPLQSIPVPLAGNLPKSLVIWTPWDGVIWDEVIWEEPWQAIEDKRYSGKFYQWAHSPTLEDLFLWETEIPEKIRSTQNDSLFGRERVQRVLLQEAKEDILASIVKKGFCHERFIPIE